MSANPARMPCGHPDPSATAGSCRVCWLYCNREDYRRLYDGAAPAPRCRCAGETDEEIKAACRHFSGIINHARQNLLDKGLASTYTHTDANGERSLRWHYDDMADLFREMERCGMRLAQSPEALAQGLAEDAPFNCQQAGGDPAAN